MEAGMSADQKPQNNIFHEKDRVIFSIAIAAGVNITFSLSDDDLEHLMEQREAYKENSQGVKKLLVPGRL
jgi:peroxiredoxin